MESLPSQSPGGGKMSEAVASSNIFKQTWGTFIFELHWVGSAIQFVGCAHLRTQFTHLRTELMVEAAEGLYCSGKMSDPGHSIGSGRLPGSLRTVLEWKNVGPRGIESEAADSQLPRCLYFPASLGRFCMTHSFSFWLRLLRSQKMH